MESLDDYIKKIDNISEKELKDGFIANTDSKINDFESLLKYLKETKVVITYMCHVDYDRARILLSKLLNACEIKNVDIEEKVDFIRLNGTETLVRLNDWQLSTLPLIEDSPQEHPLTCCQADYKYANKWGNETSSIIMKIVHDENKSVVWIKNNDTEPLYFYRYCNEINRISIKRKYLTIYKSVGLASEKIIVNTEYKNIDIIVDKFDKGNYKTEEITIDLSNSFPVGFFYRGPKWTADWASPKEIVIFRKLTIADNALRIEIENISYPYTGYALLDLENFKVIEAGELPEQ